jgi:hypothetical protein
LQICSSGCKPICKILTEPVCKSSVLLSGFAKRANRFADRLQDSVQVGANRDCPRFRRGCSLSSAANNDADYRPDQRWTPRKNTHLRGREEICAVRTNNTMSTQLGDVATRVRRLRDELSHLRWVAHRAVDFGPGLISADQAAAATDNVDDELGAIARRMQRLAVLAEHVELEEAP